MKNLDNVKNKNKISRIASLFALLAFVPYLGFLLAPVVIIWGLLKGQKSGQLLAALGFAGLLCSWGITLYMNHVHRTQQDNFHQDKHVRYIMPDIVQSIEYFKQYEGAYPASLEIFKGQDNELHLDKETISRLYYMVTEDGTNYTLLGIGVDNKPFSADDIRPSPAD